MQQLLRSSRCCAHQPFATPTRAHRATSRPRVALTPAASRKPAPAAFEADNLELSRRAGLLALTGGLLSCGAPALAVQGYIPGRVPGLSKEPDELGYYTYERPEAKQGGHGVGWSEIPRYQFKVPEGWDETPVSIADLGGTEIDLRFQSLKGEGGLAVVVAPVLRFADVGFNANVRIEELGEPDRIISGFAPELFGKPLEDDDVVDTQVTRKNDLTYYKWEMKAHTLVCATAYRNRLFILTVRADSARQWRKVQDKLRHIAESFQVDNTYSKA